MWRFSRPALTVRPAQRRLRTDRGRHGSKFARERRPDGRQRLRRPPLRARGHTPASATALTRSHFLRRALCSRSSYHWSRKKQARAPTRTRPSRHPLCVDVGEESRLFWLAERRQRARAEESAARARGGGGRPLESTRTCSDDQRVAGRRDALTASGSVASRSQGVGCGRVLLRAAAANACAVAALVSSDARSTVACMPVQRRCATRRERESRVCSVAAPPGGGRGEVSLLSRSLVHFVHDAFELMRSFCVLYETQITPHAHGA